MSIIDIARKTLIDLPVSEILHERLSLTLDYAVDLERKLAECEAVKAKLELQLENIRTDRDKKAERIQVIEKALEEDVIINHGVEFRRGRRTSGKWIAFCPKCHLPAGYHQNSHDPTVYCPDTEHCGWSGIEVCNDIYSWIREIPNC